MVNLTVASASAPFATRLAATARPVLAHLPADADAYAETGLGDTGVDERIEVSGTVVMRWAAKAHALCHEEDLTDGARVRVDAPLHWMSLTVCLGLAFAGAELVFDAAEPADAVLLTDPDRALPGELPLVLVPPRRLQAVRGADAPLPADVVDLGDALLAQPDRFEGDPDAVAPGLLLAARPASADIEWDGRSVTLWTGPEGAPGLRDEHVESAVRAWHGGGTVTVRGRAGSDPARRDGARSPHTASRP